MRILITISVLGKEKEKIIVYENQYSALLTVTEKYKTSVLLELASVQYEMQQDYDGIFVTDNKYDLSIADYGPRWLRNDNYGTKNE